MPTVASSMADNKMSARIGRFTIQPQLGQCHKESGFGRQLMLSPVPAVDIAARHGKITLMKSAGVHRKRVSTRICAGCSG